MYGVFRHQLPILSCISLFCVEKEDSESNVRHFTEYMWCIHGMFVRMRAFCGDVQLVVYPRWLVILLPRKVSLDSLPEDVDSGCYYTQTLTRALPPGVRYDKTWFWTKINVLVCLFSFLPASAEYSSPCFKFIDVAPKNSASSNNRLVFFSFSPFYNWCSSVLTRFLLINLQTTPSEELWAWIVISVHRFTGDVMCMIRMTFRVCLQASMLDHIRTRLRLRWHLFTWQLT